MILQRPKPESIFDSFGPPAPPIGLPLCGIPLAERNFPARQRPAECIWAAVERILKRNQSTLL